MRFLTSFGMTTHFRLQEGGKQGRFGQDLKELEKKLLRNAPASLPNP